MSYLMGGSTDQRNSEEYPFYLECLILKYFLDNFSEFEQFIPHSDSLAFRAYLEQPLYTYQENDFVFDWKTIDQVSQSKAELERYELVATYLSDEILKNLLPLLELAKAQNNQEVLEALQVALATYHTYKLAAIQNQKVDTEIPEQTILAFKGAQAELGLTALVSYHIEIPEGLLSTRGASVASPAGKESRGVATSSLSEDGSPEWRAVAGEESPPVTSSLLSQSLQRTPLPYQAPYVMPESPRTTTPVPAPLRATSQHQSGVASSVPIAISTPGALDRTPSRTPSPPMATMEMGAEESVLEYKMKQIILLRRVMLDSKFVYMRTKTLRGGGSVSEGLRVWLGKEADADYDQEVVNTANRIRSMVREEKKQAEENRLKHNKSLGKKKAGARYGADASLSKEHVLSLLMEEVNYDEIEKIALKAKKSTIQAIWFKLLRYENSLKRPLLFTFWRDESSYADEVFSDAKRARELEPRENSDSTDTASPPVTRPSGSVDGLFNFDEDAREDDAFEPYSAGSEFDEPSHGYGISSAQRLDVNSVEKQKLIIQYIHSLMGLSESEIFDVEDSALEAAWNGIVSLDSENSTSYANYRYDHVLGEILLAKYQIESFAGQDNISETVRRFRIAHCALISDCLDDYIERAVDGRQKNENFFLQRIKNINDSLDGFIKPHAVADESRAHTTTSASRKGKNPLIRYTEKPESYLKNPHYQALKDSVDQLSNSSDAVAVRMAKAQLASLKSAMIAAYLAFEEDQSSPYNLINVRLQLFRYQVAMGDHPNDMTKTDADGLIRSIELALKSYRKCEDPETQELFLVIAVAKLNDIALVNNRIDKLSDELNALLQELNQIESSDGLLAQYIGEVRKSYTELHGNIQRLERVIKSFDLQQWRDKSPGEMLQEHHETVKAYLEAVKRVDAFKQKRDLLERWQSLQNKYSELQKSVTNFSREKHEEISRLFGGFSKGFKNPTRMDTNLEMSAMLDAIESLMPKDIEQCYVDHTYDNQAAEAVRADLRMLRSIQDDLAATPKTDSRNSAIDAIELACKAFNAYMSIAEEEARQPYLSFNFSAFMEGVRGHIAKASERIQEHEAYVKDHTYDNQEAKVLREELKQLRDFQSRLASASVSEDTKVIVNDAIKAACNAFNDYMENASAKDKDKLLDFNKREAVEEIREQITAAKGKIREYKLKDRHPELRDTFWQRRFGSGSSSANMGLTSRLFGSSVPKPMRHMVSEYDTAEAASLRSELRKLWSFHGKLETGLKDDRLCREAEKQSDRISYSEQGEFAQDAVYESKRVLVYIKKACDLFNAYMKRAASSDSGGLDFDKAKIVKCIWIYINSAKGSIVEHKLDKICIALGIPGNSAKRDESEELYDFSAFFESSFEVPLRKGEGGSYFDDKRIRLADSSELDVSVGEEYDLAAEVSLFDSLYR